jgi:hypothetical protein
MRHLPGERPFRSFSSRRNPMKKTITIGKSAITGRFMSVAKARNSPTAIVATYKRPAGRKKK